MHHLPTTSLRRPLLAGAATALAFFAGFGSEDDLGKAHRLGPRLLGHESGLGCGKGPPIGEQGRVLGQRAGLVELN